MGTTHTLRSFRMERSRLRNLSSVLRAKMEERFLASLGMTEKGMNDGERPDDEEGSSTPLDLGPNNERLEDVKPELVHALRELVRQYRPEGVVARRHQIRRIRQARLFWQGLQYAWWNPNDMNWHLPFEQRFSDDRALEEMPRY